MKMKTEKDHIWSTLRCLATQKDAAIDFGKERRREPLRHTTAARRRKFLSRQSTRQTIYGANSAEERPIGVCQAVRGFTFMPSFLPQLSSCPNYKTQMQNCWISYFDNFSKLQEYKS